MKDVQQIVSRFRERGLKITPQRLSILNLLKDNRDHPSAEEVYREVLKTHPSISFTTVYKTLQTLRDMGELQELTIDQERAHYDPVTSEHPHVYCRSCGMIEDVDGHGNTAHLAEAFQRGDQTGFDVHSVQINLIGICRNCRGED